MIAISLAISASNQTFVKWLRKLAPKMNFITSVVLILAGSYLIYFNLIDQNKKRVFDMHQLICSGDDIKYWNAQTLIQHQVELISVPCLLSE